MILVQPFERFAKDIFGVMHMEQLVATSDAQDLPFSLVRDTVWADAIDESIRRNFRALARHIIEKQESGGL